MGFFYRYYSPDSKNIAYCNGLSYLGLAGHTFTYSYSYSKIRHHRNIEDNHTIEGYVTETNGNHRDITVYIDSNHNGEFDNNDPFVSTDEYGNFVFNKSPLVGPKSPLFPRVEKSSI